MIETEVYQFITQSKLGVLGTIGELGAPQSALVGIGVTEKLEIVFDTVKSSRKYRNLIARPECSFSIGWAGEKTVQYEGVAEELIGGSENQKVYFDAYFKAWPDGPARLSWAGIVHFVVRPKWIRYSDYDERPPLIQEFKFDSPGV
jgi:pyridoxine/pyridoxamine 5'-phosphate oxidase